MWIELSGGLVELTPEEFMAAHRRHQERHTLARQRATALLTRLLTDDQRATFIAKRHFDVTAKSGRTYRIYCAATAGNIHWIDEHGRTLGKFCVAPRGALTLPASDTYLAQLLLISCNEKKFLRTAPYSKRTRLHPIWYRRLSPMNW